MRSAIDASAASEDENAFYEAKENHDQALVDRELPGGAWYRHQLRLARIARGVDPDDWRPGSGMSGMGMMGSGMGMRLVCPGGGE